MIVKRFGCTAIHNKVLYKCIIHSFCMRNTADSGRAEGYMCRDVSVAKGQMNRGQVNTVQVKHQEKSNSVTKSKHIGPKKSKQ